jgi:hypothetical protein
MQNRHARGFHAARSAAKDFGVFMAVLGASDAGWRSMQPVFRAAPAATIERSA